jgi:hypothetical protein
VCLGDLNKGCWRVQPVGASAATVLDPSGHARFTVLTESLLRMEYSPVGVFEDRATTVVLNRHLPAPLYTVSYVDGVLSLTTHRVRLVYQTGQPFSASSLSVTATPTDGDPVRPLCLLGSR